MALSDTNKTAIAFKKAIGKVQTDTAKEAGNEAISTGTSLSSSTIFGETISPTPTVTALYDITGSNVVEFLRLPMVADPTSNGHAFIAQLPVAYEANSTNTKAATGNWIDDQILSNTNGDIQIITTLFGVPYEVKPYRNSSSPNLDDGDLVPPGDAADWTFDYFTGVFYQQDTGGADIDYIQCLVYIGDKASETSGVSTFGALTDVTFTTEVDGEIVRFNGTHWINNTLTEAGIPRMTVAGSEPSGGSLGDYWLNSGTDEVSILVSTGPDVWEPIVYKTELAADAGALDLNGGNF